MPLALAIDQERLAALCRRYHVESIGKKNRISE
jgi:hypothetical protein